MRFIIMPRLLLALFLISISQAAEPIHETFGPDFSAKRFLTPIPNKNTSVRDGMLWTRGSSGGKYPPMVYLSVEGKDLTISFRYRHLAAGGWLWFFVDGDDGFGSEDHMLRVKLLRDGVQLQIDAHSKDANHPLRVEEGDVAQCPNHRGRIGDFHQGLRIGGPTMQKQAGTEGLALAQFGLDDADRAGLILLHPGSPGNGGQGRNCRASRAVFGQKPVEGDSAHPAGPDQGEPVSTVILCPGCGVGWGGKLTVRDDGPRLVRWSQPAPAKVNDCLIRLIPEGRIEPGADI